MIDRVRIVAGTDLDDDSVGWSQLDILMDDHTSDIVIDNITGLGPVASTVNLFKKAAIPGAEFVSKSVPEKNIVFNLSLPRSTRSVDERREEIYRTMQRFPTVSMVFYKDSGAVDAKVYEIEGRVESIEPVHFTKDPTVQVSVICPSPYFILHPVINELQPWLEHPTPYPEPIPYAGSVVTGLEIEIEVDPDATPDEFSSNGGTVSFKQYDDVAAAWRGLFLEGDDIMVTGPFVQPGNYGWRPGDKVTLSTVPGKKFATLVRDGTTRSILSAVRNEDGNYMRTQDWPVLFPHHYDQTYFESDAYGPGDLVVTYRWQNLVDGI